MNSLSESFSTLDSSFVEEEEALSPCVLNLSTPRQSLISQEESYQLSFDSQELNDFSTPRDQSVQMEREAVTKEGRQVYMVTYSQADAVKCSGRQSFAKLVVDEFNKDGSDVVKKWVCGAEIHHATQGFHYHLALKLHKKRRFRQVKINIEKKYGIMVRFTDWHTSYYDCYSYVVKQDEW